MLAWAAVSRSPSPTLRSGRSSGGGGAHEDNVSPKRAEAIPARIMRPPNISNERHRKLTFTVTASPLRYHSPVCRAALMPYTVGEKVLLLQNVDRSGGAITFSIDVVLGQV